MQVVSHRLGPIASFVVFKLHHDRKAAGYLDLFDLALLHLALVLTFGLFLL